MIHHVSEFIDYFESIRRRTLNYIRVVPPEQVDWALREGEFTCGDIVRHLAGTEQMYVDLALYGRWHYGGHARDLAPTLDAAVGLLNSTHEREMTKLRALPDSALMGLRPSVLADAPAVKTWRWLMAMAEHETHHRSQLATYLTLMGIEPPQIFGVGVETLEDVSR